MITDYDRKLLIPSLDEVLAALKRVQPPYTYSPRRLTVPVYDKRELVMPAGDFPDATLNTPTVELEAFRFIEHGRKHETWRVVKMPEFYL